MLLCATGSEQISNHFEGSMYLLTRGEGGRSKPLTSRYIQQVFSRTWNTPCRIDLSKRQTHNFVCALNSSFFFALAESDMMMPGDHAKIRMTLLRKMVMTSGQQFTVRENGLTVATGIITKMYPSVELPLNKLSKLVFVQ